MKSIIKALHKADVREQAPRYTRTIPACPFGRQLAISDIHGCHRTFDALLDRIQLDRNDQLFLLGDCISRGPSSGAVLDTILDLQQNGYQVFALRGNHEQYLIDCLDKRPFALQGMVQRLQAHGLTNKHGRIKEQYESLLRGLYWYFELDTHFLVHAGFNFRAEQPLEDYTAMLTIRNADYKPKAVNGKRIVHGHTRTALKTIRKRVEDKAPIISIDNGCHNSRNVPGHGKLVCFDLTNNQLIAQKNVESTTHVAQLIKQQG